MAVEQFGRCPQNAQHKQYSYERRQVGYRLKDGHEHQSAHAYGEDNLAFQARELKHFAVAFVVR